MAGDICIDLKGSDDPFTQRSTLSPYMNSIPPSKDFFCVGTGLSNRVLHPDRAPHTTLAMQGPVVLFSGAAPQQGLNFQLSAGSLIYRNQMSTLGSPEPPPQVGTAGMLKQEPWDFVLPWSEARWHPGEDISWYGFRASAGTLFGLPYWKADGEELQTEPLYELHEEEADIYRPHIVIPDEGGSWMMHTSMTLSLARGTYQSAYIRPWFLDPSNPTAFREPWFQARGADPAFSVKLRTEQTNLGVNEWQLAAEAYPTFHHMYPFRRLLLDGGRLDVHFERSAAWPRSRDAAGTGPYTGARNGAMFARFIQDEYDNLVYFDRVPKFGWETDFKLPCISNGLYDYGGAEEKCGFDWSPQSKAWRLPHKRLRTVRLIPAEGAPPDPIDPNELDDSQAT